MPRSHLSSYLALLTPRTASTAPSRFGRRTRKKKDKKGGKKTPTRRYENFFDKSESATRRNRWTNVNEPRAPTRSLFRMLIKLKIIFKNPPLVFVFFWVFSRQKKRKRINHDIDTSRIRSHPAVFFLFCLRRKSRFSNINNRPAVPALRFLKLLRQVNR